MKRNTLVNFRAEDFEAHVDNADEAARRNRRAAQQKRKSRQSKKAEPEQSNEVPVGTTKEVLTWVGDDKERAGRALEAEQSNDKPRKSLVEKLQDLSGTNSEPEGEDTEEVEPVEEPVVEEPAAEPAEAPETKQ